MRTIKRHSFALNKNNWKSVSYLFDDWETLRDKAVDIYSMRTVPGRTLETRLPQVPDFVEDISQNNTGQSKSETQPFLRLVKFTEIY
jgi:hypothetical protein